MCSTCDAYMDRRISSQVGTGLFIFALPLSSPGSTRLAWRRQDCTPRLSLWARPAVLPPPWPIPEHCTIGRRGPPLHIGPSSKAEKLVSNQSMGGAYPPCRALGKKPSGRCDVVSG